jgi:competence protein ComEA
VLFAVVCLSLSGCGDDSKVYISGDSDTEAVTETEADDVGSEEPASDIASGETGSGEIFVYVCGAVKDPGVYELKAGDRIYEAIDMAGGFSEDACEEAINLADEASDAQMIWVPTVEEAAEGGLSQTGDDEGQADDGLIDINSATAAELMTLPGIGQSKADSIISYRDANGSFARPEDIMNVDGIKEGVYNRIKDSIKVN